MTHVTFTTRFLFFLIFTAFAVFGRAEDAEDPKRRAVRMKTSGQLKKIFKELGIDFDEKLGKEELRDLAYERDAVSRWEELHPEKKKVKDPPPMGMNYGKVPDGMDPEEYHRLMSKLRGDFSHEADPEKRRILEKLKKRGVSFSGGEDMTVEKLKEMEKMLDGLKFDTAGTPKDDL